MSPRPRFLAVTGPTTSGKTALSLALARRGPVEIVSMDSRQVYRGMDIGTDKVRAAARASVPHHCLDLVDPGQRYSAGRFARDARRWIADIEARRALPLLAGGTGFFLKSVMDPIFAEPPLDGNRLDALRGWLAEQSTETLAGFVRALDPERAEIAIDGGPQRMSRTIEVALLSGVPLSRWHREAPRDGEGVPGVVLLLELPRDEIDARILRRVHRMIDRGLVDEVEALLAAGYTDEDPGMTGTGYREIARHLKGECTLGDAVEQIATTTRRYARRQLTWFRHQLPDDAATVDATLPVDEQVDAALRALAATGLAWPDNG
ncbi:MAG: tRNA (adenosine(37)-N6)-dimethylallyltransferase MiaA [Gemmatimonadetes bacterium]|nr:tRNA (adenosine(37)-N6)-dimethylallyltransferase MiaA [Gemmatimonadota bacterium]